MSRMPRHSKLFCLQLSPRLAMVSLLLTLSSVACADHWPNWRGPNSNGVVEAGAYPQELTEAQQLWKVAMKSRAGSTPIVWDDKVFVTGAEAGENFVACLGLDGQTQWQTSVGKEREGKHKKATGSNSSPVCDGKHLFVYFKSGDFACLDLNGETIWHKNLQELFGEDTLWWDLGTSPVMTKEHIVVACVQSGPSYLAAFEPETGELAWKVDRLLDAPKEANQTYSTPIVVDDGGQETIVVLGADHVTAHDATNGKELWRVGGLNPEQNGFFRSISSPVYADGVIVAPYARGKTLTGINLQGEVIWSIDGTSSDVPTPAAAAGRVYVCSDKGKLTCLDIKTGEAIWSAFTGKNRNAFSSSPIVVGDRVYLTREDGNVFVYSIDGKAELLGRGSVDEFTVATPVFAAGRVFLRTSDHLVCFGQK